MCLEEIVELSGLVELTSADCRYDWCSCSGSYVKIKGSVLLCFESLRSVLLLHLQLEQLSGRAAVERKEMEERHTLVQNKVGSLLVLFVMELDWYTEHDKSDAEWDGHVLLVFQLQFAVYVYDGFGIGLIQKFEIIIQIIVHRKGDIVKDPHEIRLICAQNYSSRRCFPEPPRSPFGRLALLEAMNFHFYKLLVFSRVWLAT